MFKEKGQAAESAECSGNIDVSFLTQPGIYEILDVENDLSYYGETACLLSRLEIHQRQLKNGTHPCAELLANYTALQDKNNLKYIVLESGPKWADSTTRRVYESELIEKNKHRCYNQTEAERLNPPVNAEIRPIMYKGKRYESVRGALRDTENIKISRTTLIRQLVNPAIDDVFYIENESTAHGSYPIFARKDDGPLVLFPSVKAAVRAGFADTIRAAMRNLDQQQQGWRYAHVDAEGKPIRAVYTPKDGEITYEMYLKSLEKSE